MKTKIILILAFPILFFAGLITGQHNGFENKEDGKIIGLNHVGIRVSNFDKTSKFYEETMGFPMIYRFNNDKGELIFAYFQINKSTFIELMPANEEHPEGIDHFGLETQNNEGVVSEFHNLGIQCTKSSVSPFTHVNIAHAKDVNGVYFEIIEAIEGSDLRRVMDNWKE
ncbi:VOC family protein [Winogradskyella vincentii]|uniref:VOC family protein n=1 Tax=Winogradskyella vincentii TaxID=2877122 RepID=A0ABS7XZP7_9FLAO|nr:VOC family protein [Winogradskyella vincentii]MCA0153128.1 VOC family protein [Winogradskyella vincentii]